MQGVRIDKAEKSERRSETAGDSRDEGVLPAAEVSAEHRQMTTPELLQLMRLLSALEGAHNIGSEKGGE